MKGIEAYKKQVCAFETTIQALVLISWIYPILLWYGVEAFSAIWVAYMLVLAVILVLVFRMKAKQKELEKKL
ncbi:MAG: hypothetical protein JW834_02930 [Candidatus Diapherotrites archaeon]|nr:hypothetical protein [Candidatus Diapherotrites archaeon]